MTTETQEVGLYVNAPSAIETFTGRFVDIANIGAVDIHILDIAHSLAHQCRYNGHCQRYYSVAEHSCYVADYVWRKSGNLKATLAALLHDGSEAYLCDIPRPIKPLLKEYAQLEAQVQGAIYARFGLSDSALPLSLLKEADNAVLKAEVQQLMLTRGLEWGNLARVEAAEIVAEGWLPARSEREFLNRYMDMSVARTYGHGGRVSQ